MFLTPSLSGLIKALFHVKHRNPAIHENGANSGTKTHITPSELSWTARE